MMVYVMFGKVGFKLSSEFSQIRVCFVTNLCSVQTTTCSSLQELLRKF